MKKIILTILLCGIVVLGLTGCETKTNVSIEELNNINNKIIDLTFQGVDLLLQINQKNHVLCAWELKPYRL